MRKKFAASLLLALTACSDEIDESYSSLADAERAGAVERGWIPAFVPASAREIRDIHNLDTNAQTLGFTSRPSDVGAMLAKLPPVSKEDKIAANQMSRGIRTAGASDIYVVCSKPLNGALYVNRENGQAVFKTPASWADDDCSRIAMIAQRTKEICSSHAPYDDSKYEHWVARAKEAGCEGAD